MCYFCIVEKYLNIIVMSRRYNSYYFYAGFGLSNKLDAFIRRNFPSSEFCAPGDLGEYHKAMENGYFSFLYTKFRSSSFIRYQVVPNENYSDISMEMSILIERLNKFLSKYCSR